MGTARLKARRQRTAPDARAATQPGPHRYAPRPVPAPAGSAITRSPSSTSGAATPWERGGRIRCSVRSGTCCTGAMPAPRLPQRARGSVGGALRLGARTASGAGSRAWTRPRRPRSQPLSRVSCSSSASSAAASSGSTAGASWPANNRLTVGRRAASVPVPASAWWAGEAAVARAGQRGVRAAAAVGQHRGAAPAGLLLARSRRSGSSLANSVSDLMSIRQPVRRAARRAFWPSRPIASESWSSGTMTVA